MEKKVIKPNVSPSFFYGPIIAHEFRGNGISKDRDKYRIRFKLIFKSGDTIDKLLTGFSSLKEANKAKECLITELINKTYIPFQYTFSEFCDYWLYYHKVDEVHIRYSTFVNYKNLLYNHLISTLGKKRLTNITVQDLDKATKAIKANSIRDDARKRLKDMFSFAVLHNYIKYNPALAAYENTKKVVMPKKNRNIVPFTVEEIQLLLYTCKENFAEMYMPLLLSLCIGTRISETIAIKYADIDFTAGTIYIRRQIGHKLVVYDSDDITDEPESNFSDVTTTTTKTQRGIRAIPVPNWVLDEILLKRAQYQKLKQEIPDFQDNDYICCRINGESYTRTSFGRQFHFLLCMCGLPNIHWHDLRHIYASVLKNNSVNMKAVSVFLGHSTPDFTENVYVHTEETAYDCSILQEEYLKYCSREKHASKITIEYLPITDDDYQKIVNRFQP